MTTSTSGPPGVLAADEFPIGTSRARWRLLGTVAFSLALTLKFASDAIDPERRPGLGRPASLVLVLLGLFTVTVLLIMGWTGRADREGFTVEGLVRKRRIPWSAVRSMTPMGKLRPWLPRWSWWSRVVRVEYLDPAGKQASFDLAPGFNSERFRLLADRKIAGTSPAPSP